MHTHSVHELIQTVHGMTAMLRLLGDTSQKTTPSLKHYLSKKNELSEEAE